MASNFWTNPCSQSLRWSQTKIHSAAHLKRSWTQKNNWTADVSPAKLQSWDRDGEYEALLEWSQTGWELVFPLFESTQLHIMSHTVHRETNRPIFYQPITGTERWLTLSWGCRGPVWFGLFKWPVLWRVSRKSSMGWVMAEGGKVEAMNEIFPRITWILRGSRWICVSSNLRSQNSEGAAATLWRWSLITASGAHSVLEAQLLWNYTCRLYSGYILNEFVNLFFFFNSFNFYQGLPCDVEIKHWQFLVVKDDGTASWFSAVWLKEEEKETLGPGPNNFQRQPNCNYASLY